ncbi:cysteine hydrolase family protein [Hydrogenophaga sp. BPS33]|uniref:cysteine hydrolase family protein n=1 Tax=Hydrogenophaga sp. BPS33 TaxID=2651974 RepID=UPI00132038C7|nr:isochorismatase family cysteine hydrolase [Hydrogenophaga sp. BPS33]QHE87481.1 cysteine hydrolase [Hydrogenophaga sp. BPS33]
MKKVLLVLDMQNDFVHADGPSGKSPLGAQVVARKVLANTAKAIQKARAAGVRIGYVRVGFSPDYRECPPGSPVFGGLPKAGILKLGEWGSEVHPDLAPQAGDLQVVKHRVSPFHQTNLDLQLRTAGINHIYCCGVTTQAVVQATVREAHDRDYEVTVLDDCCAAHSAEEHANSMGSIARFCRVTSSDEVQFGAN